MDQENSGKGTPRRRPECDRAISAHQAARFLLALRDGTTIAKAAQIAGAAVPTLHYRRRIDADFAALWADAVEGASREAEAARAREAAALDSAQGTIVREHTDRYLVRKRRRAVEFTRRRKQIFLDHFAGSCNMAASAQAAGVTDRTVRKALAEDPAFAEGFDAALAVGYKALEADALCEQQEAREAYRLSPTTDPEAAARTFERTMQLLREYRRKDGSIGRRPRGTRPRVASNEEVKIELGRALKIFQKRVLAAGGSVPDDPPPREGWPSAVSDPADESGGVPRLPGPPG